MNLPFPTPRPQGGEARLRYGDSDFEVLRPGAFVRCAVTDRPIALDDLRYWSVDRQEPYAGPDEARRALEAAGAVPRA